MLNCEEHRLSLILAFSVLLLLCANSSARDSGPERPMNVLFLVVDDLNTWLLGDTNRYAGKVVAPNIQRLADSGGDLWPCLYGQPVLLPIPHSFVIWSQSLEIRPISEWSDCERKYRPSECHVLAEAVQEGGLLHRIVREDRAWVGYESRLG